MCFHGAYLSPAVVSVLHPIENRDAHQFLGTGDLVLPFKHHIVK